MTRIDSVEVDCPKCGSTGKAIIFDSVNVTLNPESKKDLLVGKLNLFKCTKCSHEALLDTPLLYHDMDNEFLVQYVPLHRIEDDHFSSWFTTDGQFNLPRIGPEPEYFRHVHIVFSMDELARYVIFRDRLSRR